MATFVGIRKCEWGVGQEVATVEEKCYTLVMPEVYYNYFSSNATKIMIMIVIVTVCALFCRTALEGKTEIMCLQTRGCQIPPWHLVS